MIPPSDFPRLTPDNHHISSPASTDYNCIAWAAEDTTEWWWPDVYNPDSYWPYGHVPANDDVPSFITLYDYEGDYTP